MSSRSTMALLRSSPSQPTFSEGFAMTLALDDYIKSQPSQTSANDSGFGSFGAVQLMHSEDPLSVAKTHSLIPLPSVGEGDGMLKLCYIKDGADSQHTIEAARRVSRFENSSAGPYERPRNLESYFNHAVDLSCLAGSQGCVQGRKDFSLFETPRLMSLSPTNTQGVSDLLTFCREKRAEVQDVIFLIDPTTTIGESPFSDDAAEAFEENQTEQGM